MIVSAPSISVATTVPEIEPLSERTKCSGRIPKVQSAPTTVIFPSTASLNYSLPIVDEKLVPSPVRNKQQRLKSYLHENDF